MLVVAMVAGNVLLSFFGISLSIVRVGGGMLVIASAWRLVNSPDADTERVARLAESFTPEMAKARAFYPLTFPISCGPGSIAAAITVGVSLRDQNHALSLVRLAGSIPGRHPVYLPALRGADAAPAGRQWHRRVHASVGLHHAVPGRADLLGRRARTDGRRAAAGHATNSGSQGLGQATGRKARAGPGLPVPRRGSTNPSYKIH